MTTTCTTAQQHIQQGTFSDWNGLPTDCDWTNWIGPIPEHWADVPYQSLGSEFVRAHTIVLDLEAYYRPKLYFVNGQAILFEGMNPELEGTVETLINAYGQPAAQLDWEFGTLHCAASEWVYPNRGVTLFLSSDHTRLFHIGLYAPTTLAHYKQALRPNLSKKRR